MRTHLDQWFGALEEMLASLRLRAFLVPVDDSLIRDTVLVVQHFKNLRECLDDSGIFVAVRLHSVD